MNPAFPQQQVTAYPIPPGSTQPVLAGPHGHGAPIHAAPPSFAQGDKFAHLRGVPMFPLRAASDRPIYASDSISGAAYAMTKHVKVYRSVLTRWSIPSHADARTAVVVDVYQLRNPFSFGASPFQIHVNRDVQLRVAGKFDVVARGGRVWSKHFTRQPIDEVMLLADGMAIPLEIVERTEERVAPEESEAVKKRFRRWAVRV